MDTFETTKDKILAISELLFSNKGFDGTSMGLIAGQVGINKATIYHHFKSKQEILDTLVKRLIDETVNFRNKAIEKLIKSGNDPKMMKAAWKDRFWFVEEHDKIFHIILIEILKKDSKETYLFDYIDAVEKNDTYIKKQENLRKKLGLSENREDYSPDLKTFLNSIFLTVMPVLYFQLLKDKFSSHYHLPVGVMEENFIQTIERLSTVI